MSQQKPRRVYLMIEDAPDLSGVTYAVDYGLEEGETLPEDIEQLTEAQYAIFKMARVLQSCADDEAAAELAGQSTDAPSKLLIPN